MPDVHIFGSTRTGVLGIECEPLGSQLAAFFGVKEGVLVRSVTKDSAADKAGMRAGDVISKTELTERLYDQDFERDSNVIEVLVGRLRRKLDPQEQLHPIETLRGRGYRFALPRDAAQ